MKRTIYKYAISVVDESQVLLPEGAEILSVGPGSNAYHLLVWALVDADAPPEPRNFRIVGTGHPVEEDSIQYVATVQAPPFVWHVFEAAP